ncbi:hypothetical protein VTI28DRAFT_3424 [Corynascus sepedonium]
METPGVAEANDSRKKRSPPSPAHICLSSVLPALECLGMNPHRLERDASNAAKEMKKVAFFLPVNLVITVIMVLALIRPLR